MRPPLSTGHATSLGTTAGITTVIALVATMIFLGQCAGLTGASRLLAAGALVALVLGAGGLYAGRNEIGRALDLAAEDSAASGVAAARGLSWFHIGMAGVFAGCGLAVAARVALPQGGIAWAPPAAAFLVAAGAVARSAAIVRSADHRAEIPRRTVAPAEGRTI